MLITNFLPTNQRVDVGVRATFVEGVRYFAGIDYGDETYLFKRQDAVTHRATESDPLVQKRLLEPDQTIVTLNMATIWLGTGAGSICISTRATARSDNLHGGSHP